MKSNVMKEYKIYIELKINSDFEVIDKWEKALLFL